MPLISEVKIVLMEMMEHRIHEYFKHFNLSNEDQIGKWKPKGLYNQ